MRYLRFPKNVGAAGLLLLCLLGMAANAAAGPYDGLKWEFHVPVQLKDIMLFREFSIRVQVYGTEGLVADVTKDHIAIPDGDLDTVVDITVPPLNNKNPFTANRYVIDMRFIHTPNLCNDPTDAETGPVECRSLPGTELVSHIEGSMLPQTAGAPEAGPIGVLQ